MEQPQTAPQQPQTQQQQQQQQQQGRRHRMSGGEVMKEFRRRISGLFGCCGGPGVGHLHQQQRQQQQRGEEVKMVHGLTHSNSTTTVQVYSAPTASSAPVNAANTTIPVSSSTTTLAAAATSSPHPSTPASNPITSVDIDSSSPITSVPNTKSELPPSPSSAAAAAVAAATAPVVPAQEASTAPTSIMTQVAPSAEPVDRVALAALAANAQAAMQQQQQQQQVQQQHRGGFFRMPHHQQPQEKRWLLPALDAEDTGKKCLVLDLDETLVHSSFKAVPNADFVIPVEIDGQIHNVYVLKRPGVDVFLQRLGKQFEVVVFTASLSKYADPVLDMLDKHRVVKHRLFREACFHHKGNYVKDLGQLGRDIKDVIILDNSPASYIFHPTNAVPISSWFNDVNDTELLDLIPFLEDLKLVDNVMTVLGHDGSE
ncbi:hypothetical protein HDU97_000818 [Phlyctochytrium planicorne]|nr:hypothetical protein HDU97_000818 [Phlyctochytrium planicorne]